MPRLFQNFDVYPAYLQRLHGLAASQDYETVHSTFHHDRFIALHMLKPTLEGDQSAAFALGRDRVSQEDWALKHGLKAGASREDILLAQIEHHRAEIFYNHDPHGFGSDFVARLPGCVRASIAWRAAPSPPGSDFSAYDKVVCNHHSVLDEYRRKGWNAAWFAPAHDPVMDDYAVNADRPIDILFVGTYSRHTRNRAQMIERMAALKPARAVRLHLHLSRLVRLAETPLGLFGPLRAHRRPRAVRAVAQGPVFGRELYEALASAKIVINGSMDKAGEDRGNMRCWEALGTGALMLSDTGRYPEGMEDGRTMVTYRDSDDLVLKVEDLLRDEPRRLEIAAAGYAMIRTRYSKDRQWRDFLDLL